MSGEFVYGTPGEPILFVCTAPDGSVMIKVSDLHLEHGVDRVLVSIPKGHVDGLVAALCGDRKSLDAMTVTMGLDTTAAHAAIDRVLARVRGLRAEMVEVGIVVE